MASPSCTKSSAFALDCLSGRVVMNSTSGLPVGVGMDAIRHGLVPCNHDCTKYGVLLVVLLLLLHLLLLVGPIACGIYIHLTGRGKSTLGAPNILLLGLLAFAAAAAGEIGLHVQQRWLYFNLLVSVWNVIFYGGLTVGQALLAWGLQGWGFHVMGDLIICTISISWQWHSWTVNKSEDLPRSGIAAEHLFTWVITFGALFCTSVAFVIKMFAYINRACPAAKKGRWGWTAGMATAYTVGIVCSTLMKTGWQWWHVPTAASFCLGFTLQILWVFSVTTKEKTL